jgi:hypothetical protein
VAINPAMGDDNRIGIDIGVGSDLYQARGGPRAHLLTVKVQGAFPKARRFMKLFNFRKALALGGLLIATLAAGCAAGPGWSSSPYGYNAGYGSSYPYNGGGYGAPYPYNSGYQPSYPYTGGYQNPSYYNQYQQNRQTFNQQYQKNLQTYDQQHPYNQPQPHQPYNQRHPSDQQHPYSQPYNQQHKEHQDHPENQ